MKKTSSIRAAVILLVLLAITVAGALCTEAAMVGQLSMKDLPPSWQHPFGTDRLGRDMLLRTVAGLSLSIRIGVPAAAVSGVLALLLGLAAATLGEKVDAVISWCIDLVLGVPHILLVMLISLACGKGFWGVVAGLSLSHWGALARVVRGEVYQLKTAPYLETSRALGVGRWQLVRCHYLPHLAPQLLTGMVLEFPHAILHEASITFLGFGLPAEQPAIGVILSESMGYLTTGKWWLALLPALALIAVVALFAALGRTLHRR